MTSELNKTIEEVMPPRHNFPTPYAPVANFAEKTFGNRAKEGFGDTYVGIEIEVEGVFRTSNVSRVGNKYIWRNIEDGSLRNNGREFVSIPIKGVEIPTFLNTFYTTLNRDEDCSNYQFSDRTSIHVHVNYRDQTVEQLSNLILTYLTVEPFLYDFVGGDRKYNIYCVPITQSNLIFNLSRYFRDYERGNASTVHHLTSWMKYTGFNLLTLQTYGTVEFRHLVGTDDQEHVEKWIKMLMALKEFSSKQKYEDLKAHILDLNTSSEYHAFVQEIFGDLAHEFKLQDIQKTMEDTVIFLKDMFVLASSKDGFYPKSNTYDKEKLGETELVKRHSNAFIFQSKKKDLKESEEGGRITAQQYATGYASVANWSMDGADDGTTLQSLRDRQDSVPLHRAYSFLFSRDANGFISVQNADGEDIDF